MKVNIFIDESGTNKIDKNSTVAFVYIEVVDQKKFDEKLISIEKKLQIKTFHWVENSWKVREKILHEILYLDFICKIMISHNPVHGNEQLEKALQYLIVEKNLFHIIIDGNKNKAYTSKVKKMLRNKNISTKKIQGMDDKNSPVIRLADFCAGLSRYYYDNKDEKSTRVFNRLKSKIEIIFEDI